jgi:hypothetical protein
MIQMTRPLSSEKGARRRSSKLTASPESGGRAGFFPALVRFLFSIVCLSLLHGPVLADPVDDLTVGEAFYMTGDLHEAARSLSGASRSKMPAHAQRALYLLGRISLLTGDFRQAKEYFERSADIEGAGSPGRWMALAGIGDTLYLSGRYEEAIRRYRMALRETGSKDGAAVISLKAALCEQSLGRDETALDHLRSALEEIPVLSGWAGREEEFYYSMLMVGIDPARVQDVRIFILAGPIEGNFRLDELIGPDIPVKETRKNGASYLECGPFADSVEAMILSEKIRSRFKVPVEIIKR